MCLNPIDIYNPQRYINLYHGDQFRLTVPCGQCAECKQQNSVEWHFRMHYMFKDCIEHGGYVLFETLTYNDVSLPHVSDFIDTSVDYSCFNREHIREFLVRLRRMLDYRGFGKIKYFLSAEYGHDNLYRSSSGRIRKGTIRPHYHILVFADSSIPVATLCRFIKRCWKYGATDWSNHNDKYMLANRVFNDYSLHGMRLANYVAKYVQKDSDFTSKVFGRIRSILDIRYPNSDFCSKANYKSDFTKLKNIMCQFHLQSKEFGLSFIHSKDFDRSELERTGMIKMVVPDNPNIYKHIPLPMYYFRHLYQHQIEIDGKRFWELTIDGVRYRKLSEQRKHRNFVNHLHTWRLNIGRLPIEYQDKINEIYTHVDLDSLASYVLFLRYRYKSVVDYTPLSEKIGNIQFYHYGSMNDAIIYDKKFVTPVFLGNDVLGYDDISMPIPRKSFASSYTYVDEHLEYAYRLYLDSCKILKDGIQETYDYKQRLDKLYKSLFAKS